MTDSHLPTAATTELFERIIHAGSEITLRALDEPDSTGDERYDTLLSMGLAYVLTLRGLLTRPRMEAARR